jgi:hypothetical protein
VRGLTILVACGVHARCSNSTAFSDEDPRSRRAHNQLLGEIFSQRTNTHELSEKQISKSPHFLRLKSPQASAVSAVPHPPYLRVSVPNYILCRHKIRCISSVCSGSGNMPPRPVRREVGYDYPPMPTTSPLFNRRSHKAEARGFVRGFIERSIII